MTFKNILTLAVLFAVMGTGAALAQDTKAMTKSEVEKVIHTYLLDNPQVILESVSNFQKKSMEQRRTGALVKYEDALFRDDQSPVAGNAKGDVTVVEFMDYNCHFCKEAFKNLNTLMESDKNLRVVFKDYPVLGPSSELAAKWALAAHKQKKYFEYHKALMANKEPIDESVLEKLAKEQGLDIAQLKKDAEGEDVARQIEKDRGLGAALDINGTPAFIIGDEVIPGAVPVSTLKKIVADQRKKSGKN